MNRDIPQYGDLGYTGQGYLVIRVSAASQALPVEGAKVIVRGDEENYSSVVAVLETGNDGLTPKIALLAPPRALSEEPGNARPFATYNIEVFKDGYYAFEAGSVPIFDEITSVQGADLIPLPAGENPGAGPTVTGRPPEL